jgi:undecaprenyl-diphosphatase
VSDILNTIYLGIIEGITEFLPVSSTGHLLVAEQFLGARSDLFNVGIQAGAIVAVLLIYWNRLTDLFLHANRPENRDFIIKYCVSVFITLALGFVTVKMGFKLPETVQPVAIAFLIGGILILAIEQFIANKPKVETLTWSVAIWVGLLQVVAGVFPGTSRSAATIFAAMLAGMTFRPAATEFAFLVGIPTMFAATGFLYLKAHHEAAQENWTLLAIGFVVSGIVAFVSVKWLLRYIQSHRFTLFAWYRIVLGIALLAMAHQGIVH